MIVTVTDATFDEVVLRATRPVLVDYTAEWCPPWLCDLADHHHGSPTSRAAGWGALG